MIVVMRYFRDFFFLSIPLKTILVIVTHCIVTYKEILEATRKFDANGLIVSHRVLYGIWKFN